MGSLHIKEENEFEPLNHLKQLRNECNILILKRKNRKVVVIFF